MKFRIYPIALSIMCSMLTISALEQPQPIAGRTVRPLPPTPGVSPSARRPLPTPPIVGAKRPLPKTPTRRPLPTPPQIAPPIAAGKGLGLIKAPAKPTPVRAIEPSIVLVSSDGMEFKVPLEIAEESEIFQIFIRAGIKRIDLNLLPKARISGEVLEEIAQLMNALYQHKNLDEELFFQKIGKNIPVRDKLAFLMAVKILQFEPGITFISQKYDQSGDYSFPKDEYEYWMKRIKQIDPQAYETLRKCEAETSKRCLEIAVDPETTGADIGVEEIEGYPIIIIDPLMKWKDESVQNEILKYYIMQYKNLTPITEKELLKVLEIVKSLAPTLYEAIRAVDPTGIKHIQRYEDRGVAVSISQADGLPVILIDKEFQNFPNSEARATIAHELGHYILGHLTPRDKKVLDKKILEKMGVKIDNKVAQSKRKALEQEIFKKAFSREQEFEADRFAVVELGVPIDDAIAQAYRFALEEPKESDLSTFERTHPLWKVRIKNFEELRREVELRKSQKRPPLKIDWKKLAADYYKSSGPRKLVP